MVAVSDVMTDEVVTLAQEATMSDAARIMVRGGFGSVVVVHGRMIVGMQKHNVLGREHPALLKGGFAQAHAVSQDGTFGFCQR